MLAKLCAFARGDVSSGHRLGLDLLQEAQHVPILPAGPSATRTIEIPVVSNLLFVGGQTVSGVYHRT